MTVAAIIVAAGRGLRAGGELPKQYRPLAGRAVLALTLKAFSGEGRIVAIQPVVHPDDLELYGRAVAELGPEDRAKVRSPVSGGASRQASVLAGLEALEQLRPEIVLVHDAARPFVSPDLLARAIEAAGATGAAVPGTRVTDTIKVVDGGGFVSDTPSRETLRAVQTPQAFAFPVLLEAHRRARAAGVDGLTDDGAVAEWAGVRVAVFDGDPGNVKLTHPGDFAEAERRLGASPALLTRLGTGFDVHAFTEGDHVWLGGVCIPHDRGVLAHSDGDVVLHALTDALLGSIADGDIGVHFPPSDPQWRGASSDRFLAHAAGLVRARGGIIDHLDVTLLCERPRVGPYRDAIRARIAQVADVPVGSVSIKATTTEQLGFTGRGEGLAAQAAATVRLPPETGA